MAFYLIRRSLCVVQKAVFIYIYIVAHLAFLVNPYFTFL